MSLAGDLERDDYDEFQFLQGHADWAGLAWNGRPVVARRTTKVDGRDVSWLAWGEGAAELVLVHGAGQNAHTWDTFVMAVGRPCIAIDLPGHGRSGWRDDRDYGPDTNAIAIAAVIDEAAPDALAIVGMSLGGLTTYRLSARRPDLVRRAVIVDITPQLPPKRDEKAEPGPTGPMQLMRGPRTFASFQAILDATAATLPHRTPESLIPSLRHNARQLGDGSWTWRYDELRREDFPVREFTAIWEDVSSLQVPVLFVKGALSPIVSDEAMAELRSRLPAARIEVVADAAHSVQNDKPVELAALVNDFLG